MKKVYSRDNPPDVPKDIAKCPICDGEVKIDAITEWHPNGEVLDYSITLICKEHEDCSFLSGYEWFAVDQKVVEWLNRHYRLAKYTEIEEMERLKRWVENAKQFR